MKTFNELVTKLGSVRSGLMGIAMLAVVFYHMYCWIHPYPILKAFKYGYIGVDVFLLMSGFGLCYSYNRNSLARFYFHRLMRIFPLQLLFSVAGLTIGIVFAVRPIGQLLKTFLLKATTMYYWLPGCDHGNWFVPALIFLYSLFPIIYKIVVLIRIKGILMLAAAGLFYSYCFAPQIGWYYDCLVARVHIFCLGIIAYLVAEGREKICAIDVLFWLAITVLSLSFNSSGFFRTAMITPFFVLVVSPALLYPRLRKFLESVGVHSFEMFLGCEFGFSVAGHIGLWRHFAGWGGDISLYLVTTVAGFAMFYYANLSLRGLQGRGGDK